MSNLSLDRHLGPLEILTLIQSIRSLWTITLVRLLPGLVVNGGRCSVVYPPRVRPLWDTRIYRNSHNVLSTEKWRKRLLTKQRVNGSRFRQRVKRINLKKSKSLMRN